MGDGTTCARRSHYSAYCWGNNSKGQIGDGTTINRLPPTKVLDDTVALVTNGGGTCAITNAFTLKCWGNDRDDLLDQPKPTDVRGVDNVTAVSLWGNNTCAVTDDQLMCWGDNFKGQVSDGSTDTRRLPLR